MSAPLDHPILARLTAPGPKRILSLDGGGIRGALTLGFLVRMEALLRKRHGNPRLLLRDYFDLIGGTSTGAIIAASLAIGSSTEEILAEYQKMGDIIFERPAKLWQVSTWLRQRLFYRNAPAAIEAILRTFYSDPVAGREYILGDHAITTGLCIVTKRVDTFSVWPMHNNPRGRYYASNKDLPLWRVVRASSAAPTFFPPTIFAYDGSGKEGAFVDGGVSTFNNPAMLLYLIATLKGFRFEWPTGEDRLMVVSVGTGTTEIRYSAEEVRKLGEKNALFWGSTVPDMFIRDCNDFSELLLQGLSESPTARNLDGEVRDLEGDHLAGSPQVHYVRYNAAITPEDIAHHAQLTATDLKRFPRVRTVGEMMKMDVGGNVFHLAEVGRRAAAIQMEEALFERHFPRKFDLG